MKIQQIKIGRAFINWSSSKLLRFKCFLIASKYNFLIANMRTIYFGLSKLITKKKINSLIDKFYGDIFIGGKNEIELEKIILKLNEDNVLSISDFAMEFIGDHEEHMIPSVVKSFKKSIDATSSSKNKNFCNNMIAIKMSSLATITYLKTINKLQFLLEIIEKNTYDINFDNKDDVLEAINRINHESVKYNISNLSNKLTVKRLRQINNLFLDNNICTYYVNNNIKSIVDKNKSKKYKYNVFEYLISSVIENNNDNFINNINKHQENKVKFLMEALDLDKKTADDYLLKTINLGKSIEELISYSIEYRIHLMVDAEQTYLQTYIDYVVSYYFRVYNQRFDISNNTNNYSYNSNINERLFNNFLNNAYSTYNNYCINSDNSNKNYKIKEANLSTTIQFYLKDGNFKLNYLIDYCEDNNLNLGIKMVRGAYISEERKISQIKNIPNPICINQKMTDINYNNSIKTFIERYKENYRVVIASHNLESINYLNQEISNQKKDYIKDRIIVAQLLGLGENASWLTNYYVIYYLFN